MRIATTVNGVRYERDVEPRTLLVDFLREDLDLVGTHIGCEHGVCGTCTVLMNGETIRSCITFAVQADGQEITTVEGLARQRRACTRSRRRSGRSRACSAATARRACSCAPRDPGREPGPDAARRSSEAIASNLCRCTGYPFIVDAVLDAAPSACGDGGTRA